MTTKETGGWPSFLTQMPETWLESCKTFSSTSQAIAERWLSNRSEQAQQNLDAVTKLAGCKSPAEFAEVQQRWLQDTVERFTAEVKSYQDQVGTLSQQALSAADPSRTGPSRPSHPKAA